MLANKQPGSRVRGRPPARPTDVRRHNLALVMQLAASGDGISRAEIARVTGLTKGTISLIVQELIRLGLLVELGPRADGSIGRPRSVLAVDGDRHCVVGLEIAVDYLAVCIADLLHRVRFHRVETADNRGLTPERVLDRAGALLGSALETAAAEGLAVAGIGVAIPGMVDVSAGRLLVAPNLGWSDLALVEELGARLGGSDAAILADNEANLAALAELWLGAGRAVGDYVYVSAEIGVGAGLIVGGTLFRGARGFAGEMGHIVVDPNGPACSCGGRGCLERVAGQEAILRRAGLPTTTATSVGHADSPLPALVALLREGNPEAAAAVREAGTALGVALADVVNLLDPDTLVLGGIYAALTPWLAEPLESALARQVVASSWRPIRVSASALGPDAAVRGAAAQIVQRVLAAPGATVAA